MTDSSASKVAFRTQRPESAIEIPSSVIDGFEFPDDDPSNRASSARTSASQPSRTNSRTGSTRSRATFQSAESPSPHIERCPDGKDRMILPSVQEYWHTYTSWLACWPAVAEVRNEMANFRKAWDKEYEKGAGVQCFCVVHRSGLRVRKVASWKEEHCTGKYLGPGQCFIVADILTEGHTNYLKLVDDSGWVFDSMDKITMCVKLESVEIGQWWYRITTEDFVEVRSAPSDNEDCRSGWIMCPKEVTVVNLRCDINGHRFLQLADGRGWLFETKPGSLGRRSLSSGEDLTVMSECTVEQESELAEQKRVTVELEGQSNGENSFKNFNSPRPVSPKSKKQEKKKQGDGKEQAQERPPTNGGMRCFALCGRSAHRK